VLVADAQFLQAKISYVQAVAQRLQDSVALYVALGGGWWERAGGDAWIGGRREPAANVEGFTTPYSWRRVLGLVPHADVEDLRRLARRCPSTASSVVRMACFSSSAIVAPGMRSRAERITRGLEREVLLVDPLPLAEDHRRARSRSRERARSLATGDRGSSSGAFSVNPSSRL